MVEKIIGAYFSAIVCLCIFNQFFRLKGYFSKNNAYFCSGIKIKRL